MKFLKNLVLLVITLIVGINENIAQQVFPVQLNGFTIPPRSLDLSVYSFERSQDLVFNATLNDPIEPFRDARLSMTIRSNNQEVYVTDPNYAFQSIRLNQFELVTIDGSMLAPYLNPAALTGASGFGMGSVTIPEGFNQICIQVIDVLQNKPISNEFCVSGFFQLNQPPQLSLPVCGEQMPLPETQNLLFNWTPMHIGSGNSPNPVEYKFELVKLLPGVADPNDGFEAALKLYETTSLIPSLLYTNTEPTLEAGATYAWRVQAQSMLHPTSLLFENEGYSAVCTFTYVDSNEGTLSDAEEDAQAIPQGCEVFSTDFGAVNSTGADPIPLVEGDIVKVGFFNLEVLDAIPSGDGFSGTGFIVVPMLKSKMQVNFTDLKVKGNMRAYAVGSMIADVDQSFYLDPDLLVAGNLENVVTTDYVQNLDNYFTNGQGVNKMISAFDPADPPVNALPIGMDKNINGEQQPLIAVTGLRFTERNAFLTCVGFQKVGNEWMRFVGTDLNITPLGVKSGVVLSLLDEINVPINSIFELSIEGNNPNSGMAMDCAGYKDFSYASSLMINSEVMVEPIDEGLIMVNYNSDGDPFKFVGNIENFGDFKLPEMSDFVFTMNSGSVDIDDGEKLTEFNLNNIYQNANNNNWKGLYLNDLSVKMPAAYDFTGNGEQIVLDNGELVIGEDGAFGTFRKENLVTFEAGNLGNWRYSVDTMKLQVNAGTVNGTSLSGRIRVPLLDEPFNYNSELNTNGGDITLSVQPEVGDKNMSLWGGVFEVNDTTVIEAKLTELNGTNTFTPAANLYGDLSINLNAGDFENKLTGNVAMKLADLQQVFNISGDPTFILNDLRITDLSIDPFALPQNRYQLAGFGDGQDSVNIGGKLGKIGEVTLEYKAAANNEPEELGLRVVVSAATSYVEYIFWGKAQDEGGFYFDRIEIETKNVVCNCISYLDGNLYDPDTHQRIKEDYYERYYSPSALGLNPIGVPTGSLANLENSNEVWKQFVNGELEGYKQSIIEHLEDNMVQGFIVEDGYLWLPWGDRLIVKDITEGGVPKLEGVVGAARKTAAGVVDPLFDFDDINQFYPNEQAYKLPIDLTDKLTQLGIKGTKPFPPADEVRFLLTGFKVAKSTSDNNSTDDRGTNRPEQGEDYKITNTDGTLVETEFTILVKTHNGTKTVYSHFVEKSTERLSSTGINLQSFNLMLDHDVDYPGQRDDNKLTLKKTTDDSGNDTTTDLGVESYVSVDCDGFNPFNIHAEIDIPQKHAKDADNPDQKLRLGVKITGKSLKNFIATVEVNGSDGQPIRMQIPDSEVASFEFGSKFKAYLDMDAEQNPNGFPEDFSGGGTDGSFKGIYVEGMKVRLDGFTVGDDDGSDLMLEMEKFVLGRNGVEGKIFAKDVVVFANDLEETREKAIDSLMNLDPNLSESAASDKVNTFVNKGTMNSWAFSIDTIAFEFKGGKLQKAPTATTQYDVNGKVVSLGGAASGVANKKSSLTELGAGISIIGRVRCPLFKQKDKDGKDIPNSGVLRFFGNVGVEKSGGKTTPKADFQIAIDAFQQAFAIGKVGLKMQLQSGSVIGIRYEASTSPPVAGRKSRGTFKPYANLSGNAAFVIETPKFEYELFAFQDFGINMPEESATNASNPNSETVTATDPKSPIKKLNTGTWGTRPPESDVSGLKLGGAANSSGNAARKPKRGLQGFPLVINSIDFAGKEAGKVELVIDIGINLMKETVDDGTGESGSSNNSSGASASGLSASAKMGFEMGLEGDEGFKVKAPTFKEGKVKGAFGPVKIEGAVSIMSGEKDEDGKYKTIWGDGFKAHGKVDIKLVSVNAIFQFGTTNWSEELDAGVEKDLALADKNGIPIAPETPEGEKSTSPDENYEDVGEEYRYFFVDLEVNSETGLPIIPAPVKISLHGIGGGFFYNMDMANLVKKETIGESPAATDKMDPGITLSGSQYIPKKGGFGGKISLIGSVIDAKMLALDAYLALSIYKSDAGKLSFSQLQVGGGVYLKPESISERRDKFLAKGFADINMDFGNKQLSGQVGLDINFDIPKVFTLRTISGNGKDGPAIASFLFNFGESKKWYVKAGRPPMNGEDKRIGVKLAAFDLLEMQFKSYFQAGYDVDPIPEIGDLIPNWNEGGKAGKRMTSSIYSGGNGFAFGLQLSIPRKNYEFLMFNAYIEAGIGFDVSMLKYKDSMCPSVISNEDFGLKNWWLQGQAYAYLNGGMGIKYSLFGRKGAVRIFDVSVAAVLMVKFPNPSAFAGRIKGSYSVLNGMIKGKCNFKFQLMSERDKECFEESVATNPIADLPIVADATPNESEKDKFPVFGQPKVLLNIANGKILTFKQESLDLTGGAEEGEGIATYEEYRINLKKLTLIEESNNKLVPSEIIDEDPYAFMLKPNITLKPTSKYKFKYKVCWEERIDEKWQLAKDDAGDIICEEKTITFTTDKMPDAINKEMLAYQAPGFNQVYWHKGYANPRLAFNAGNWEEMFPLSKTHNNKEVLLDYVFQLTGYQDGKEVKSMTFPLSDFPGLEKFEIPVVSYYRVGNTNIPTISFEEVSKLDVGYAAMKNLDLRHNNKSVLYHLQIIRKPVIPKAEYVEVEKVDEESGLVTIEKELDGAIDSEYASDDLFKILYSTWFGVSEYASLNDKIKASNFKHKFSAISRTAMDHPEEGNGGFPEVTNSMVKPINDTYWLFNNSKEEFDRYDLNRIRLNMFPEYESWDVDTYLTDTHYETVWEYLIAVFNSLNDKISTHLFGESGFSGGADKGYRDYLEEVVQPRSIDTEGELTWHYRYYLVDDDNNMAPELTANEIKNKKISDDRKNLKSKRVAEGSNEEQTHEDVLSSEEDFGLAYHDLRSRIYSNKGLYMGNIIDELNGLHSDIDSKSYKIDINGEKYQAKEEFYNSLGTVLRLINHNTPFGHDEYAFYNKWVSEFEPAYKAFHNPIFRQKPGGDDDDLEGFCTYEGKEITYVEMIKVYNDMINSSVFSNEGYNKHVYDKSIKLKFPKVNEWNNLGDVLDSDIYSLTTINLPGGHHAATPITVSPTFATTSPEKSWRLEFYETETETALRDYPIDAILGKYRIYEGKDGRILATYADGELDVFDENNNRVIYYDQTFLKAGQNIKKYLPNLENFTFRYQNDGSYAQIYVDNTLNHTYKSLGYKGEFDSDKRLRFNRDINGDPLTLIMEEKGSENTFSFKSLVICDEQRRVLLHAKKKNSKLLKTAYSYTGDSFVSSTTEINYASSAIPANLFELEPGKKYKVLVSSNKGIASFDIDDDFYDSKFGTTIIGWSTDVKSWWDDAPTQKPFKKDTLTIPGIIPAAEYDLGGQGIAYYDFFPATGFNGAGVNNTRPGHQEDLVYYNHKYKKDILLRGQEWMKYTVNVKETGDYELAMTYFGKSTVSMPILLELDGVPITLNPIHVPNQTNGEETVYKEQVKLNTLGVKVFRIKILGEEDGGSFNLGNIKFTLIPKIAVQSNALTIQNNLSVLPAQDNNTDFGLVNINEEVIDTFYIINSGKTDWAFQSGQIVTIEGSNYFSIKDQPKENALKRGESTWFTIKYLNPNQVGANAEAVVTVRPNDPLLSDYQFKVLAGLPGDIAVFGNGQPITDGDVSPSVNDGTYFTAWKSVETTKSFMIKNEGTGRIRSHRSNLFFTGKDADLFSVISYDLDIYSGQTETLELTFKGETIGNKEATLHIKSNDPDEADFTFDLIAEVQEMGAAVEGEAVDLIVLGRKEFEANSALSTTISTYSSYPSLTLGLGEIAQTTEFEVKIDNNFSETYYDFGKKINIPYDGDLEDIEVELNIPSSSCLYNAIEISGNPSNSLSVNDEPTSLKFIITPKEIKTFGYGDNKIILNYTIPFKTMYTVEGGVEHQTLNKTFTIYLKGNTSIGEPPSPSNNQNVVNNYTTLEDALEISRNGAILAEYLSQSNEANPALSHIEVDYGFATIGTGFTEYTYTISNKGATEMYLPEDAISINPTGDYIVYQPLATTIPSEGSTTFKVRFEPQNMANNPVERKGTIHIKTLNAGEVDFDVKGEIGVPEIAFLSEDIEMFKVSAMEISRNGLSVEQSGSVYTATNYGLTTIGAEAKEYTFTINNKGIAEINLSETAISVAPSEDFTIVQPSIATIPVGGSTTFKVRFQPKEREFNNETERIATITVHSLNAGNFDFKVKGKAELPEGSVSEYYWYRFKFKHSNKALSTNGYEDNNAQMVQYQIDGFENSNNQRWKFKRQGTYFQIISKGSDKSLEIEGGSTTNGGKLKQNTWNGSDNQLWKIETYEQGDQHYGFHRLKNKKSGKHICIAYSSHNNGADAHQWAYETNPDNNKRIKFEQLEKIDNSSSGSAPAANTASQAPVADITLYQQKADFGIIPIGKTKEATFKIINEGNGLLKLTGSSLVSLSGKNAADFKILQQPIKQINGIGEVSFKVRFAPKNPTGGVVQMEDRTASLTIKSNDTDEGTIIINLKGVTGTPPKIKITGNGKEVVYKNMGNADDGSWFGSKITVGTTMLREFKIENIGGLPLEIQYKTGTESYLSKKNEFYIDKDDEPNAIIQPGESTLLKVGLKVLNLGNKKNTVRMSTNDPNKGYTYFNVGVSAISAAKPVGTVTMTDFAATNFSAPNVSTLAFGSIDPGETVTKKVKIWNAGANNAKTILLNKTNANLTLNPIDPSNPNNGSVNDFSFSFNKTSIAPNESAELTITLDPKEGANYIGTYSIPLTDANDETLSFSLTGTGLQTPAIGGVFDENNVKITSFDFGTVIYNTATAPEEKLLIIKNTGTGADLNISLPNTLPQGFSVQLNASTVAAGQSETVKVKFTPLEDIREYSEILELTLSGVITPISLSGISELLIVQTPFNNQPTQIPGTINITEYDEGGEGIAHHDTTPNDEGGNNDGRADGVDIVDDVLGWTANGEWLEYTINVAETADYLAKFHVSSGFSGGDFHLESNGTDITGKVSLGGTGDWYNYTIVEKGISLTQGEQVLRFVVDKAGFNIKKIEIEKNVPAPENIALNKPASASSQYKNEVKPSRIVDGNTDGRWNRHSVFHSSTSGGTWVTINLEDTYDISEIKVFNRTDGCCKKRVGKYYLMISDTPFPTDKNVNNALNIAKWNSGQRNDNNKNSWTVAIPSGTTGRYVRFQFANNYREPINLAEIQVFGIPAATYTAEAHTSSLGAPSPATDFKLSKLNFGKIKTNTESQVRKLKIWNTTVDANAPKMEIFLPMNLPEGYQVSADKYEIAKGEAAELSISFKPKAVKNYDTKLDIQIGFLEPSKTLSIDLFGEGIDKENIAFGKSGETSSVYHEKNPVAAKATDGLITSYTWTDYSGILTNQATGSWYTLDLGSIHNIDEIVLYRRLSSDFSNKRWKAYYVMIGDSKFPTNTNVNDALNVANWNSGKRNDNDQPGTSIKITVPNGTVGRYVRVQLDNSFNEKLDMPEIMVFGTIAPPAVPAFSGDISSDQKTVDFGADVSTAFAITKEVVVKNTVANGGQSMTATLSGLPSSQFKVKWKNGTGLSQTIAPGQSAIVQITSNATNAEILNKTFKISFAGTANSGAVKTITVKGVAQRPFKGTPLKVPGVLQIEDADLGLKGFAYFDTDKYKGKNKSWIKNRRKDDVDLWYSNKVNSYYKSRTETGEWIEFTIDVKEAGYYVGKLKLYPFKKYRNCDLMINNEVLTNFKTGWDYKEWEKIKGKNRFYLNKGKQIIRLKANNYKTAWDYLELTKTSGWGWSSW